jgi:hypothetical protein
MGAAETRAYIEHRLKLVGWKDDPHFTDQAFEEIYKVTGGVPRKINTLCSRLMLFGYLEETHEVVAKSVDEVANELKIELSGPVVATPMIQPEASVSEEAVGQMDRRLSRMEERMDQNSQAIKRALALIAARMNGDGG